MTKLRHVDLCSGIGGFALGFQWAELSKTIMFCDTEKWCREILAKNFPETRIEKDVKELANDPERLVPDHDILTAGYPCQPFSVAGLRKGEKDDRHIWPYIFRIITCKRPTWCVFENVYGHIALGLDKVLADLESEGYSTRTFVVPACAKDAFHRRDRLWIIAHSDSKSEPDVSEHEGKRQGKLGERTTIVENTIGGRCEERDTESEEVSRSLRTSSNVADSDNEGLRSRKRGSVPKSLQKNDSRSYHADRFGSYDGNKDGKPQVLQKNAEDVADSDDEGSQGGIHRGENPERQSFDGHSGRSRSTHRQSKQEFWTVEPNVGRVAHGIPRRVDRLKGLGNAIVPQISMQIGLAIKEHLN